MEERLINIDPEKMITTEQAAELMGTTAREVRAKIQRGKIPAVKIDNNIYMLQRGAITMYLFLREVRHRKYIMDPKNKHKF